MRTCCRSPSVIVASVETLTLFRACLLVGPCSRKSSDDELYETYWEIWSLMVKELGPSTGYPPASQDVRESLNNSGTNFPFGGLVLWPSLVPNQQVKKKNLRIFYTICGDHGGRVEVPGGKGGPPDDEGHLNCPYSDHHDLHVDQPELECPTGRTLLGTALTYSPSQDIWGMDVEKTRILEETNPEETLEIQVINLEMMSQWTNRTHQKRNFNCVIKHWQKDLQ